MSTPYLSCWRSSWLLVLLLLFGLAAHAQTYLNLGMEPRTNHGYPLVLWAQQRAPAGRAQFDSTTFRQGRGSLRLELAEEEERVFMALYTGVFPLDSLRGQLATVSGWVRTRGSCASSSRALPCATMVLPIAPLALQKALAPTVPYIYATCCSTKTAT